MRGRTRIAIGVLAATLVGALAVIANLLRYGLSAHDKPSRVEHVVARAMRHYATPADLRGRRNPVPLTDEVLAEARAHFADHCAVCHGNDGKGKTVMGPRFYPKAPDMTLGETQAMSDGEIFATRERHPPDGHAGLGRRDRRVGLRELDPGPFHPSPPEDHARRDRRHGEAEPAATR